MDVSAPVNSDLKYLSRITCAVPPKLNTTIGLNVERCLIAKDVFQSLNQCVIKLTHSCLVDLSIFINWTSPFPNTGVSGVFLRFIFILFLIKINVSTRSVASDLGLQCLPKKWDARHIWVKGALHPYMPPYQVSKILETFLQFIFTFLGGRLLWFLNLQSRILETFLQFIFTFLGERLLWFLNLQSRRKIIAFLSVQDNLDCKGCM